MAVRRRLEDAGIPDAALEAECLVRTVTGISREAYFADGPIDEAQLPALDRLVARRLAREPLAYISGEREFYGLSFGVNAAVLVPRPESELLVELALDHLEHHPRTLLLDVGTGSGCLAVSIEKHRGMKGRTVASDVSAPALAVARANAHRHGVAIEFVRASLTGAFARADLIVANLPYVPSADVDELEPELRNWEPRIALDGGTGGTELIAQLVDDCATRLRPGRVLMEVAAGQAPDVAAYARERGFEATTHRDLAGIERVVDARWP